MKIGVFHDFGGDFHKLFGKDIFKSFEDILKSEIALSRDTMVCRESFRYRLKVYNHIFETPQKQNEL